MHDSESVDAGKIERFMVLYSSHQRRLYLYILTLLPASVDADDVIQEANLVLWRKFDQYEPGTNFFAWACQIVRYEVLKHRERRRTQAAMLLDPDVIDSLADAAQEQIDGVDDRHRQLLLDCMARLTNGDRELMRRRYTVGMTVQAIAAAAQRSPNAISKSLGRIRRLLLDCVTGVTNGEKPEGKKL